MGDYSSIDCRWSWDGDYIVSEDGDLRDTSDDLLRSTEQEIQTIVKSEMMDWELDPMIGANLSEFVGRSNTREIGRQIEDRIRFSILNTGIVTQADLSVRVVPINIHQIAIMINLISMIHTGNRLTTADPVSVNAVFDTSEYGIFFANPDLTPSYI